jgi:GT2 family glycosyltransferase
MMKRGGPPEVRVIIPNYNGAHLLPDCLRSLRAQQDVAVEIVVVDNGSIDESEAVARRWGAAWLPLGVNRGMGAAINEGARDAEQEFLFFASSDMRFEPECVATLLEALSDAGPEAFCADPLQFDWEGERIIHYWTVLRPARSVREALADAIFQAPARVRTYAQAAGVCEIPWGCGGSLLVRRPLFAALGGFDPTFLIDFEDVDLGWRAAMRGWTHWFVPKAHVYHHWGGSNDAALRSARPDLARRLPRKDRGRVISLSRNHTSFALKVLDPYPARCVVLAKLAAAGVYVARGRVDRGLAIARGVAQTLACWPSLRRQRAEILRDARVSSRELLTRFRDWDGPEALIWPSEEPCAVRSARCAVERSPSGG